MNRAIAGALALAMTCAAWGGGSVNWLYYIWVGGDGMWSDTSHWIGPTINVAQTSAGVVYIDNNNPAHSQVYLDVNQTVADLIIDEHDALTILNGRSLTIGATVMDQILGQSGGTASPVSDAGMMVNHGVIRVGQGWIGEPAQLLLEGPSAILLDGSGEVRLTDSFLSHLYAKPGKFATLQNESAIRGAGIIGADVESAGALRLINSGVIEADRPAELLTIETQTSLPDLATIVNSGTLQASQGGHLLLRGGTIENSGTIHAANDSQIDLNSISIIGGAISSEGTGIVRSHSGGVALCDIALSGRFEIGLTQLTLSGTIQNGGQLQTLAGNNLDGGDYSQIIVPSSAGVATLEGGGTANLMLAKITTGDAGGNAMLINGEHHTIRGEGLMGDNAVAITNHGTIIADRALSMIFDPPPTQGMLNSGTIRAVGAGGVVFTSGQFTNAGTVEILPGSRAVYSASATVTNVANSTLSGGTWRVIADGVTASVYMPGPGVFYNDADVTLSGVNSKFPLLDGIAFNLNRLAILDGRRFTTVNQFFINQGELMIGRGSRMTVNGSFTQPSSGELQVELGASNLLPQPASLVVNGQATIAGALRIMLSPETVGQAGKQYRVMSATGGAIVDFSSIIAPQGMHVIIDANGIVATPASCPADLDSDEVVNVGDLLNLISGWGMCPGGRTCNADISGDGIVGVTDLLMVIASWGPCPG